MQKQNRHERVPVLLRDYKGDVSCEPQLSAAQAIFIIGSVAVVTRLLLKALPNLHPFPSYLLRHH